MRMPVRSDDGHAWELPIWAAEGCRRGLLWLPALGVPAGKYARWAESLQARGIAVAVHEWRGNASSSLRPSRRQDWGYRELLEADIPASQAQLGAAYPGISWAIGGHSLGGQLAAMAAARRPDTVRALVLLATGVPDSRTFAGLQRLGIAGFARAVPAITRACGLFPGDRLKWAGREAATLMRQWAGTVTSGGYRRLGLEPDIEPAMKKLALPALGIRFQHDWLVPEASLEALFAKLGAGDHRREVFDDARLSARADHFRWMRAPDPVADVVAGWMRTQLL